MEETKAPQEHISAIFKEYTTPSRVLRSFTNLSNTVIQTSLSGQSKFLFEILQNTDDAFEDRNKRIEVQFILEDNFFIIHHDGKGFDFNDVERICDYASQIEEVKANDLSKTGYKGLGFKSLFNLSNCIYIYSNGYSFRFDKTYWPNAQSNPWQIIPIWCRYDELPLYEKYSYDQPVNIILKLNNINEIESQLKELVNRQDPLLYLHRINKLVLNLKGEECCLERKIEEFESNKVFNVVNFYKNEHVVNTWLLKTYDQAVPKEIQASVHGASSLIYPSKIKEAKSVPFTFALQVDQTVKEVSKIQGLFYNLLPTQLHLALPYHINSFFILNLDRTQLHENEWNEFLIYQIGRLQLSLLKDLSEIPFLRNYVIELLVRSINHSYPAFCNAFRRGFGETKSEISWLPAHDGSPLLKLGEGFTDQIEFHKLCFPNDRYPKIIDYDVRCQNSLSSSEACHFSYDTLFKTFLEGYYPKLITTKDSYKNFISYLYEKLKNHPPDVILTKLGRTPFLPAKNKELFATEKAVLEESENPIPDFSMLNPIDNEYLPVENAALVKQWLVSLGARLLKTPAEVIRLSIMKWIDSDTLNLKINVKNHIEIINYLAKGIDDLTKNEIDKLKEKLLILTESNRFELVKLCYLADTIPITELKDVISEDEQISSSYNMDSLKEFLVHVGVHERVNFIDVLRKSILIWIKSGEIRNKIKKINYAPFIEYIAQHYNSIEDDLTKFEKLELTKLPILTCAENFQDSQDCYFDSAIPNVKGLEYGIEHNVLVSTQNVSDKVKRFLAKIGVSEIMTSTEVVRRSILRWIQEGEIHNRITIENHNSILEYIAKQWNVLNSSSGLKPNEIEALKNIPVLTKSENFREAINCYCQCSNFLTSNNCIEIPGLESIVSSDEFVSQSYSEEIMCLLYDLGVHNPSFVDIYESYSDHLTVPVNIKWFFTHLIKYWEDHKTLASSDKLLNFVQQKLKSVSGLLGKDGNFYCSTTLYSAQFSAIHSIDPNSIPLLYCEELPEDLEIWLGFKKELELTCIVQLLKAVKKKPKLGKESTSTFFITLLKQLKLKGKSEIDKYQLSLLSKSNELKHAKDLYYFIEENATCVIASCYLKRIHRMSHDETLELAQLCGVNTLTFKQELIFEPGEPKQDNTLKEFYLERLPFIVLQESAELNESPSVTLRRLYDQICCIELNQCCNICIRYPFGSSKVQSHFENLKLYVTGGKWDSWKHNSKIHKHIKEQLGFKTDIAEIIDMKIITQEDKQDWLSFKKEDPQKLNLIEEELKKLIIAGGADAAFQVKRNGLPVNHGQQESHDGSTSMDEPENASHSVVIADCIQEDIIEVNANWLIQNQSDLDNSYTAEHISKKRKLMASDHYLSTDSHQIKRLSEKYVFTYYQNFYKKKYPKSKFIVSDRKFTLWKQPTQKIQIIWVDESEEKECQYHLLIKKNEEIKQRIKIRTTNVTDNDSNNMSRLTFIKKINDYTVQNPSTSRVETMNNEVYGQDSHNISMRMGEPEVGLLCKAKAGSTSESTDGVNTMHLVQTQLNHSCASGHSLDAGPSKKFQESSKKYIKHLGEKYVFIFLQNYYKNKYPNSQFNLCDGLFKLWKQPSHTIEVIWLNESEEKGNAYDLLLKKDGEIKQYIKVKSTDAADNDLFKMSHHTFIKNISDLPEHKAKYSIYLVFNVGSQSNNSFPLYNVIPLKNFSELA